MQIVSRQATVSRDSSLDAVSASRFATILGHLFLSRAIFPVLPFLAFVEKGKEKHQKNKDFYPYRTPNIPGKEWKNAQKNKEILAEEKSKEFQKCKERKDRVAHPFIKLVLPASPGAPSQNLLA